MTQRLYPDLLLPADTTAGDATHVPQLTVGQDGRVKVLGSVAITGTAPAAHASTHQHGGGDEVATATAAANAIPKAGAGGQLAAGWMPALTGDVTTTAGAVATTLANSGVTAGTYGDATHIPQITFDAKGRATGATTVAVTAGGRGIPGGRLTLATGTPVVTADQTGRATIYYTPYLHDQVPLYDGTVWTATTFAELSLALDSNAAHTGYHQSGKNFDLFVYNDAGTLRLVSGPAWSSDTGRSLALGRQNGVLMNNVGMTVRFGVNSGDTLSMTALRGTYVGTFRAVANGQTCFAFAFTNDVERQLYLWNMYNRVDVAALVAVSAASWTYAGSGTWRSVNGSTSIRVSFVRGIDEEAYIGRYSCERADPNTSLPADASVGVGLDTTTGTSAEGTQAFVGTSSGFPMAAEYKGLPGLGYHFLQAVENTSNANAATFRSSSQSIMSLFGRF